MVVVVVAAVVVVVVVVILNAPSHKQDSTYHGLCCTSRGALAGMRNSLVYKRRLINNKRQHTRFTSSSFVFVFMIRPKSEQGSSTKLKCMQNVKAYYYGFTGLNYLIIDYK